MSVTDYEAIVRRLDDLDPTQIAMLMGEIQARMAQRPRRRLEEFMAVPQEAKGTGEDWVRALRAEWEHQSRGRARRGAAAFARHERGGIDPGGRGEGAQGMGHSPDGAASPCNASRLSLDSSRTPL